MTGTGDLMIFSTMPRIDVSSPPGVRRTSRTASALRSAASSSARPTNSSLMG
jgi:hypothetical protein